MFRPEIDLLFSELIEPAGPTKDGKYEALIATEETAKSLEYINSLRENQGLNKLEGYIIKLIGNEAQKLSSTDIRE
jgi:phosphopantetheine adenylyltransferase